MEYPWEFLKDNLIFKKMRNKLNLVQRKYLSEIRRMVVSHTTKKNPNYHLAEELEKIGFLKLIKSDSPLIRTILTNTGKEYIKTIEELIEKKVIGEEDYQMTDGNYTERYETFVRIRKDRPYNVDDTKYLIYESDKIKGKRLSIVDLNTGEISEEISESDKIKGKRVSIVDINTGEISEEMK